MLTLILMAGVWIANAKAQGPNAADGNTNIRMQQLLNQPEDVRQIRGEWHQYWKSEPGRPYRVNGIISP